jgi:hypothetical protein
LVLKYFKRAVTSYRIKRFQVPTRLTTVTRQTGEYKVDLTRHPKFPLAFGELASDRFPHCYGKDHPCHVCFKLVNWFQRRILNNFSIGSYVTIKSSHGGHLEFPISKRFTNLVQGHPMIIPAKPQFNHRTLWEIYLKIFFSETILWETTARQRRVEISGGE